MAKRGKKLDTRGPMQRFVDAEKVANDQAALDVITPEQLAKGTYTGSRSTIVNNHDPVKRWTASGKLSQPQQVVIEMVQRLWRLAGISQRLTASYGERMDGGGNTEIRALTEIEAREDLHRIQDHVPSGYWFIFEQVCRHGMAAGIAGGGGRGAETRAYTVVCFVADVICMKERICA